MSGGKNVRHSVFSCTKMHPPLNLKLAKRRRAKSSRDARSHTSPQSSEADAAADFAVFDAADVVTASTGA